MSGPMSSRIYKVYLVVDPRFGERLTSLPCGKPVWIVDSPVNTPVIRRLWSERPAGSHLTGITSFVGSGSGIPDEDVIGQLDTIDLHHCEYSADPPYAEIEVIGAAPSDDAVQRLEELGFRLGATTEGGFIAVSDE
jgi:hypothetical protein